MAESAVSAFEQIQHSDDQGEYWLARELGKPCLIAGRQMF
jgi:hypothetical protein